MVKSKNKFLLFAFLPIIEQIFAKTVENYFFGLGLRILMLIIFPIIYIKFIQKENFFSVFKQSANWKVLVGTFSLGLFTVLIAYSFLHSFIDKNQIIEQVAKLYSLTIPIYILVGLLITFLNPFIEEFFWRGFIFKNYLKENGGIWIGSFFALHHIVILYNWLNLSLLIASTVLLGIVGILFNYFYEKYNSIYPPLLCHIGADLGIILVGFLVLF